MLEGWEPRWLVVVRCYAAEFILGRKRWRALKESLLRLGEVRAYELRRASLESNPTLYADALESLEGMRAGVPAIPREQLRRKP